MNRSSDPARMPAQPTSEPSVTRRLREIHRAASDLRRGVPVLLTGAVPLVVLAAETAGPAGLGELAELGAAPPVLLLAPLRAAAVLRRPAEAGDAAVAVQLPASVYTQDAVRRLADPTAPQPGSGELLLAAEPPALASAALGLAKLVRLLPAVVAAPARDTVPAELVRRGMLSVAAADVLSYPGNEVAGLRRVASAPVPLDGAPDAQVVAFRTDGSGLEHLAIVIGDPAHADAPLVRIHSECFTGDLLGSMRCDCGPQLRGAIRRIAEAGSGVVLYLGQEGRGIGLVNKLRAYTLQDRGLDTLDANRALGWDADERNFLVAGTMLTALGIKRVRLLTNNPDKVAGLSACGVEVVEREAHAYAPNGINDDYLATKAARFGHMID
jgi:GTP cyclohydrolase II